MLRQQYVQVTADLAPGFVRDIGADKVEFKFNKPKTFKIGGSYSINCVVKPAVNVDLFVGLPKVIYRIKLISIDGIFHLTVIKLGRSTDGLCDFQLG